MNIKIILDKATNFTLNRLSELIGILLVVTSTMLMISLISYSPEDPNFIFPDNINIKNLLGIRGSYVSDIFYQSIGLISLLIPISIFFIGINIFRKKNILIIIESLFFIIVYSVIGTIFFSVFHKDTYWLTINGNDGFIGNFFEESFIVSLIKLNESISYYLLLLLINFLFLKSISFQIKKSFKYLSSFLNIFKKNKKLEEKIEEEKIIFPEQQEYQQTRIQENFSFENKLKSSEKNSIKYKFPSIDFLKVPSKKE